MQKETKTCGELISELSSKFDALPENCQYWIGLAGGPGSGKSTVAGKIKDALGDKVVVIPMDGYHFYRSELDAMENPQEAQERRGAPFTFNARKLLDDLIQAHETGSGHFPDFDHCKRDPEERSICLESGKKIVIVEGNYLLLSESPWNRLILDIFDEGWFLDVPLEECKRRVLKRHQQVMKMTREESMWRVLTNDGPNAELVINESIENADRIIEIQDPTS
ncbi:MAG: zeta toxin family protein [Luteolibacter sp.]